MKPLLRLLVGPIPGHPRPRLWFLPPMGRVMLVLVVAVALWWLGNWVLVWLAIWASYGH